MSKWMNLLQEEIDKNKSNVNPPMSALSAPFGGLLEKLEKNKSIGKLPMSVLSVVSKGVSFKFNNNIKNICNNPSTPADKADIGSFSRKKYQAVDFADSFCVDDIKNICNNLQTPADKADIGSFSRKNPHLVDFPNSFADAIEIIATRNRPKEIRESRWITIVTRLNALVRDEKHHLLKMIEHGWSLEEVFGCHKVAPDARIDGMGLLMLLGSSTIAEVYPERALLNSRSGSMLSYYLGAMNRNLSERSTLMEIE